LVELELPAGVWPFEGDESRTKLFYKTDLTCLSKPVFRSIDHASVYQFQSPNNRWWTLYDTSNSTYTPGIREWCDAWNAKPLLSMALGMFQHPLGKHKRAQRWQRVSLHERNKSYAYKSVASKRLVNVPLLRRDGRKVDR
jgi:hypothetical protein